MGTKPQGTKARPITDVTSTLLGKEEMVGAMWHMDRFLHNNHENSKYTTTVAR
jgi:hypothetical protein